MSAPHQTHIKVRGYHLDVFQHVNNARYLEFLEEARWSFLEDEALTPLFMQSGYGMAVVNININYRQGALLNDELIIETYFRALNQRNAVLRQIVKRKRDNAIIADADIVFVVVDMKANKAIEFPDSIRERLESLVQREE